MTHTIEDKSKIEIAKTFGLLKEGFRLIRKSKVLIQIGLLTFLFGLFNAPVQMLMASMVNIVYKGQAYQVGILDACFSIGLVACSLVLNRLQDRLRVPNSTLFTISVLSLGGSLIINGSQHLYWLSAVMLVVYGSSMAVAQSVVAARNAIIIPYKFIARVSTIFMSLEMLTSPIAIGLGGPLFTKIGIGNSVCSVRNRSDRRCYRLPLPVRRGKGCLRYAN